MAEQTSKTVKASGANANQEQHQVAGELTFEDKVIQKIIGIALENVSGLLHVDGGFFSNMAERISSSDNVTNGIETEVGKEQVAVDLDVVIEYRKDAEQIYDQIKKVAAEQVKKMTHLDVVEVNVHVEDIKTKEEIEQESETVQDKVTSAGKTTGQYISQQTNKATQSISEDVENIQENREPRVE